MKKAIVVTLLYLASATTAFASPITTNHRTLAHIKPTSNGFNLTSLLYNKYYFALKNPKSGAINYTRDGDFFYLSDGYLVQRGNRLQGYPAPTTVLSNACQLSDIQIPTVLPPEATSNIKIQVNLDARSNLQKSPFNPKDYSTFNYEVSKNIFDSLGGEHEIRIYFVQTSLNHWTIYTDNQEKIISSTPITFNSNGNIFQPDDDINVSLDLDNGAETPQALTISLTGSTQFNGFYETREVTSNGHNTGHLQSLDVDELGDINTVYTSGTTLTIAKIAVFPNAE